MNTKTFNKGDVIVRQGEYASTMYDITCGKVKVVAGLDTPEEKEIAQLGEGNVFGEMGLIECLPHSASVVALEDGTRVQEISAGEFSEYFKNSPDKVLAVMRQMSARLRETNQKYADACRTVYDTVETEKKGEKKSGGLLSRLNFFHKEYRDLRTK